MKITLKDKNVIEFIKTNDDGLEICISIVDPKNKNIRNVTSVKLNSEEFLKLKDMVK